MNKHIGASWLGSTFARLRGWASILWRWEARFKGVRFEGRATFLGRPQISVVNGASMVIGDGVCVASAPRANVLACAHPSVMRVMAPGARLILGRGVGLSATVLFAGHTIEIGDNTILGSGAMVVDNDLHTLTADGIWASDYGANARPVRIGRSVFIGARAMVLKGVTVGDCAVIGAGAVVTKDVPAGCIAVGNPARIIAPKESAAGRSPESFPGEIPSRLIDERLL